MEDRKADAVAHLAVARSQNTGPAFWVTTKDNLYGRFFLIGLSYEKLKYTGAGHEKRIKGHKGYT